jgi:hypothetical protein
MFKNYQRPISKPGARVNPAGMLTVQIVEHRVPAILTRECPMRRWRVTGIRVTLDHMTAGALKDAFAENRFPLALWLADGQKVQVKHRDYMFVPPTAGSLSSPTIRAVFRPWTQP